VIETASGNGAACDAPFDERLRGLLETAWPGVSESISRAESIGVHWRALSTTHFAPRGASPVAHAGLLQLPWSIRGEPRRIAGIHAVCVHPLFQGRGFMRQVIESALLQCDAEFEAAVLFTVEPALYRRFGFRVVPQVAYELREPLPSPASARSRVLDAACEADVATIRGLLGERDPISRRLAMGPGGVDLFLLNEIMETGGFRRLHLIPALETVAAAEMLGSTLVLHDLVARRIPPLFEVLAALPFAPERVELHFAPDRLPGLRFAPLPLLTHEHLMVRGSLGLDEGELVVPQHIRC
jgi:GNAT superfamily N-acetyltransferase